MERQVFTDALWVKNFAEFTLSSTVFDIQAFLCFATFAKNLKIQNGHHFWRDKKASLHRYPVGQKFCGNPISKFLFYEENGFKKYSYHLVLFYMCTLSAIFPILCSVFFIKNSKIEYGGGGGGEKFWKLEKVVSEDTLWVENLDETALSHTVKEIQAVLYFNR